MCKQPEKTKYQKHIYTHLQLACTRAAEDLEVAQIALRIYEYEHRVRIGEDRRELIERYGR